jgi:hypothetical protein
MQASCRTRAAALKGGEVFGHDAMRRISKRQRDDARRALVQQMLRAKARTRARWIVGVPGRLVALLGLLWPNRRLWIESVNFARSRLLGRVIRG